jgi:hypothetical protein
MGTTKTSTWLGRTGTALAEGGVRHVLIKFVHWLTHRWVDFGGIYVFLGQLNWPDPPSLPMDIFFASAEDIPRLIRDLLPERSAAELQARFSRGDSCVAAAVPGGPIVHTHWFSRRYAIINEIGRQFALGPDEVYFYDSFTSLQRRGQGIERAMATLAAIILDG